VIAIPTTAGTGSEVTPVAVMTVPGQLLKVGVVHPHLIPSCAIVDPQLTVTAPAKLTASVAIDALSHALESYIARNPSVFARPYNLEAMKRIRRSLRKAVADGFDREAREDLAIASLFAGIGLACTGVGAVHAITYPIAAKYHIGHGESIALFLPESLRAMLPEAEELLAETADALGVDAQGRNRRDIAEAVIDEVERLIRDVGLGRKTREYQADPALFREMAETAAGIDRLILNSPRILTADEIERIYERTY
jgi:alcohol dehydrogenase class IV